MLADGLKILLLSSDPSLFETLSEMVLKLYSGIGVVDVSSDFDDGLKRYGQHAHHIYLVDYALKPHNGLEFLQAIESARSPIIFLSPGGRADLVREALISGAVDYLDREGISLSILERSIRYAVERRKFMEVEEELREQRQFLRQVIDINPNFVFAKNRAGKFTLVNQAVADAYGTSVEGLIGKSDADFNPNLEEVEHFRQDDLEVMERNKEKFVPEEVITDARGNQRWLQTVKRPLRDAQGRSNQVLGIATDITARKKAEEALRESEQRYRVLAESSAVGIWHVKNDGETIYINPTMCQLLEIDSPEELSTRRYHDFFPPASQERMELESPRRRQGLASTYEVEIVGNRGGRRSLVLSGAPLVNENGIWTSVIGTFVDITDKKAAEQALLESEERYRMFAENITVGFWHTAADNSSIYLNRAMRELVEIDDDDELVGKTYRDIFTPESCKVIEAQHELRLRGISSTYEAELIGFRGTRRFVVISAAPIFNAAHELESYIATLTDITEQKRAERERREIETQMQHAQKLESLGVLAGGIAHDFNNLLMGVLGNAGLALSELPLDSNLRPRLDRIKKAAERAAELTNQLLAYAGKGTFAVTKLDLSKLVEEMGSLLQTAISKKASLEYACATDLPVIEGDITQIRQVVMNLITNASDAIGGNPGTISIRTGVISADKEYLSRLFSQGEMPAGDYCFVEVRDTGSGMDKDTLSRIFDPFFTTKFAGRGLGLAAVLGIIGSHGGGISVESKPREGTTFRILFPVAEGVQQSEALEIAELEEWRGKGTVLVIDDEETVLEVAQLMLERVGFNVLTAAHGFEGVAKFEEHAPEIVAVLVDMTMPDMNGEETLRRLRDVSVDVPVILSSGYSEQATMPLVSGQGFNGFLQKPYGPNMLVQKVREVLA